ncbi:hypothetical protein HZS_4298 [Henneguya salminicola]|nr:hypothetical protein HZS_4298 [Henneguya salminicola]
MDKDTEVNEDHQDVETLFDRSRPFVKVPEDVPFKCFLEAYKDLPPTAVVSKGNIFEMSKPSKKNEDKELDGQNFDRVIQQAKKKSRH